MIKPLKILTIGFEAAELAPSESLVFSVHSPGITEGMTPVEYFYQLIDTVSTADLVMVKTPDRNLREDEMILIYTAYTTSTPVFGADIKLLSPIFESMVANRMSTEDLLDHLQVHYSSKISL